MGESSNFDDPEPHQLPPRLFAVGCYPRGARFNIYSKAHVIGSLATVLAGTKALEELINSQFGLLFHLPVARCANSVKLLHGLLSRQLLTNKKHELWIVYGGQPIRFSLREFHIVTGLLCGPIPSDEDIAAHTGQPGVMWKKLFGTKSATVNIQDVLRMLDNPNLPPWKRLPLALLVIVDGILICNNKNLRINEAHVAMLDDIHYFLSFPWGRRSFAETFSRVGPPLLSPETPDQVEEVISRLKQLNSAFYGFPLPLQLLAFEAIPKLLTKIPNPDDLSNFIENPSGCKSTVTLIHEDVINEVESDIEVRKRFTPSLFQNNTIFIHYRLLTIYIMCFTNRSNFYNKLCTPLNSNLILL